LFGRQIGCDIIYDWSNFRLVIERVADPKLAHPVDEDWDEGIGERILYVQARHALGAGEKRLKEDPIENSIASRVDVSAGIKHKGKPFARRNGRGHHSFMARVRNESPDVAPPSEADLSNLRTHEGRAQHADCVRGRRNA
jgi:hypothetical protein